MEVVRQYDEGVAGKGTRPLHADIRSPERIDFPDQKIRTSVPKRHGEKVGLTVRMYAKGTWHSVIRSDSG